MQSSNMSAGGESSSEVAPPTTGITAQETASDHWKEYDALEATRYQSVEREYSDMDVVAQAPNALSIMRRRRCGSEDVVRARKNMMERTQGEGRGEDAVDGMRHFSIVTPRMPVAFPVSPPVLQPQHHPVEEKYVQDRIRWEREMEEAELHRHYYAYGPDYDSYGYQGFRGYYQQTGGDENNHHAPMPAFLGDAYRRHEEMGYEAEIRERYLTKGGYTSSDHNPRHGVGGRPSNIPNFSHPVRQVSPRYQRQPRHVSQIQPATANASPQRPVANNGRVYQEMDWKHDRIWREDNHTRTPSADFKQAPQDLTQIGAQTQEGGQLVYSPAPGSVPPRFTSPQVQDRPTDPRVCNSILPPPKLPSSNVPHNNGSSKKSVSFSDLQIRTYETILSDNPSCSTGPSLGLGWRYDPCHYISTIDEYEYHQSQLCHGVEIRPEDLVLHRFEREAILLDTGYSKQDLADSIRGLTKVKNRRRQTVHNLPVAWVEERIEGCRRTLRRWILNKGRTRSMYDEWRKYEATNGPVARSHGAIRGILVQRRSG